MDFVFLTLAASVIFNIFLTTVVLIVLHRLKLNIDNMFKIVEYMKKINDILGDFVKNSKPSNINDSDYKKTYFSEFSQELSNLMSYDGYQK